MKVAAIQDLPEWGRKKGLHAVTPQSHSVQFLEQDIKTSDHSAGHSPLRP